MALIGQLKREKTLQLNENTGAGAFSTFDSGLSFFSPIRGPAIQHNVEKVLYYGGDHNQDGQKFSHEIPVYLLRDLRWLMRSSCGRRPPNRFCVADLRHVPPYRKSVDTLPTYHKVNSRDDCRRLCNQGELKTTAIGERVFLGRIWWHKLFSFLHEFLPMLLGVASRLLLHKKGNS